MRKLYIVVALLLATCTFTSCTKNEASGGGSLHDALVGRWRETSEVYDANGNGIMDASEVVAPTGDYQYVFYTDGTGYKVENNVTTGTFTWSLINNSQAIQFNYTSPSPAVIAMNVYDISSSALTLKNTSSGAYWIVYARQQ